MIVCVTLNGYSSSLRNNHRRTERVVRDFLKRRNEPYVLYAERSSFLRSKSRRIRKFIYKNESRDSTLLLVGKSFGGKQIIEKVLNRLNYPLQYERILCLTVDPCWPTWTDWTPNLNHRVLHLRYPVDQAINLYVPGRPDEQCGALVRGAANRPVADVDHYSIVLSPDVPRALENLTKMRG